MLQPLIVTPKYLYITYIKYLLSVCLFFFCYFSFLVFFFFSLFPNKESIRCIKRRPQRSWNSSLLKIYINVYAWIELVFNKILGGVTRFLKYDE